MNFSKDNLRRQTQSTSTLPGKLVTKTVISVGKLLIIAVIFTGVMICAFGIGTIRGIIKTSPSADSLSVVPLGIATTVYNANGEVVETLVTSGSNRDPVTYDRLPQDLIDAFVAIEDARFWTHEGVDLRGMIRAFYSTAMQILTGNGQVSGASTITQQLLKNSVFDGGREKGWGARFIRKFQEQYLALVLERSMDKEDILINYLNTINLGSNCLGVQVASKRYFAKDVSELTLSECAVIAGITQNPYALDPIRFPARNEEKRAVVLKYMEEQGYITAQERAEALADTQAVYQRIADTNRQIKADAAPYSYFTDAVIEQVLKDLQTELGYNESEAYAKLYSGGLSIYTTQDPAIQAIMDEEVNNPDHYPSNAFRYSMSYRLSVMHADGTNTHYSEYSIYNALELSSSVFTSMEDIDATIEEFKQVTLAEGDTIVGEKVSYTLQPQTATVLMDHSTGHVLAITGGRGSKEANRTWSRATQTYRSPGSCFKILASFAPAIDAGGETLASVKYDEPYEDISNYWGSTYVGYANARQGILASMNVLTVKFMMESIGVETAFEYCENFGLSSLVRSEEIRGKIYSDLGPTFCLGGLTKGVNVLEMTAAYSTIANKGTYLEPILYTKITNHDGTILIDNTQNTESREVLKQSTAFLLTDAMASSMKSGSVKKAGIYSTATAAALQNMAAAGKSGTSTNSSGKARDLWFVGYTPYYSLGIWTGFDDGSIPIQGNVSNQSYHFRIWKAIMDRVHADLPYTAFEIPEGITMARVCSMSGGLATDACSLDERADVYYEYFAEGTAPKEKCSTHVALEVCAVSGQLPGEYCKELKKVAYVVLPEKVTGETIDTMYAYLTKPEDIEKDKKTPVYVDKTLPTEVLEQLKGSFVTCQYHLEHGTLEDPTAESPGFTFPWDTTDEPGTGGGGDVPPTTSQRPTQPPATEPSETTTQSPGWTWPWNRP